MSSPKQIRANQLNSKKSTGPKSHAGKSIVSKNALKHGILSSETILPWEKLTELQDLISSLLESFKPVGKIELLLVDRMASVTWRLKRAGRIETGLFDWKRYSLNYQLSEKTGATDSMETDPRHLEAIQTITANPDLTDLAYIFLENSDSLSSLSRYEASLEKAFYKALHELQRLQASRAGSNVQLPIAIDINADLENKDIDT